MFNRRTPILLKHGHTPGARDFAILAGLEAAVRGLLISVMPLVVYRAYGDAKIVSHVFFLVGIVALCWGLMVPWLTRFIPRRWMYTLGACSYLCGMTLVLFGGPTGVAFAVGFNSVATVTCFVCLNAYVLDYVARPDLGRAESMKMIFAAAPWTFGPITGVALMNWWEPAPFVAAGLAGMTMVAVFWYLRLGNGKAISKARGPTVNPLSYLGRFFAQPRLIAGWLFAVVRSCGWWVYVVYLPIFCVESGLGDKVGGLALSVSNATLFMTPVIRAVVTRSSVRRVVRFAFAAAGCLMILAGVAAPMPWITVGLLYLSTIFLITLDVTGGLPFLMAVKPSERTEMAAVYSSFRDVSGIATPGIAAGVLLVTPLSGIFVACGLALWGAWGLAGTLHPRLGQARRVRLGGPPPPSPTPEPERQAA